MRDELLAPLDLAFWHLESADHPLHLGALAVFEPSEDTDPEQAAEEAAALLAARAAAIPWLRMRVRGVLLPFGGASWSAQPSFDVRRHVHRVWLNGGGDGSQGEGEGEAGLNAFVGEVMERPVDRGLPPWEIYVIARPDGGPGSPLHVLIKLHHALADGMRAVAIGASLLDQGARTDARAPRLPPALPAAAHWSPRPQLPQLPLPPIADPRRLATQLRARLGDAGQVVEIGRAVMRASLAPHRTATLTTTPSATRRVGTAVLELEELRRIRRRVGGTVNDILLTVVSGMLREWALQRGEGVAGCTPRALVPVSRRRPGKGSGAARAGNRLSGFLVPLPVADPDPVARLRAVRAVMDRSKAAGPVHGPGAVAVLADYMPPLAHRLGAPLAGYAARLLYDILVTSVPLPCADLSLGGNPLTAVYPLAPLARGQRVSVAMSTYRGRVHLGLLADGRAAPDVDRLAAAAPRVLAELAATCVPV